MEFGQHNVLMELLKLKRVKRRGWLRHNITREEVESVADHSFGVMLLSWLLAPVELDKGRVLELGLVHDLAEVITGDIIPADQVEDSLKKSQERDALTCLTKGLSQTTKCQELLREYQEQTTAEAKWVKSMDRLDMALQSLLYEEEYGADLQEFRESARASLRELGLEGLGLQS